MIKTKFIKEITQIILNCSDKNKIADEQMNSIQKFRIVKPVIKEISEALGLEYDEKEQIEQFLINYTSNISLTYFKNNLQRNGNLISTALLCRKNGFMPYFVTKIIAQVFVYIFSVYQESDITLTIKNQGIKTAIEKYCGIEREVQLTEFISDQYNKIVAGKEYDEEKKVDILKKAYRKGFLYEKEYGGCAQCLIASLCDISGKDKERIFRNAGLLSGGGAGRTDGSCGSYCGGLLFISSYTGRSFNKMIEDGDEEAVRKANKLGEKLHEKYINTYGSVICENIQNKIFGRSFHLWEKEEAEEFDKAGAHDDKCPSVVATACYWVAEILFDEGMLQNIII